MVLPDDMSDNRLPTLPVWLDAIWASILDLETSYEETCRVLRIV